MYLWREENNEIKQVKTCIVQNVKHKTLLSNIKALQTFLIRANLPIGKNLFKVNVKENKTSSMDVALVSLVLL